MKIKKSYPATLFCAITLLFLVNPAKSYAHCEIPCGIYTDSIRVVLISEHIATIKKSMEKIHELSSATPTNYNQLIRWINNKEEHATKIQVIATQYFLFQRVKLSGDKKRNTRLLELLHQLCVHAMKSKQTTDLLQIDKLTQTLEAFSKLYFNKMHHHH